VHPVKRVVEGHFALRGLLRLHDFPQYVERRNLLHRHSDRLAFKHIAVAVGGRGIGDLIDSMFAPGQR